MNFVAIEFDNHVNNTHVKGYLRIPSNFDPVWHLGFRKYLRDKYKSLNIKIYPLNIHQNESDTIGKDIVGFKNMEDDFILALRNTCYYPNNERNNHVLRQWAMLDPMTESFTVKER